MKYKRRLIMGIALVSIITGGSVFAATHNSSPLSTKATTAKIVPTITPNKGTSMDNASTMPTSNVQSNPIGTPTAVISQVDQNRTQLQSDVTAAATLTAQHLNRSLTTDELKNFINVQWACVDKLATNHPGYDVPYATLLTDSAYTVLKPAQDDNGMVVYSYFDTVGTCRVFSTQPN